MQKIWSRRVLAVVLASAAIAGVTLASPATASLSPVRCSATDVTADGRVFPEPMMSATYLRFPEFQCAIAYLESAHKDRLQVTSLGTSRGGAPIYDVLLTDESVTTPKEKLLVASSIHGNEQGAREGAARVLEDMVDARFLATEPWVKQVLAQYVIHFVFPNPDGWVNGDILDGGGIAWTRANDTGTDLNRNFPVKGWISTANRTLQEPESNAINDKLLKDKGWYLGTDNHGQSADTYAAAGLQIVGQFDFQKSETLARFADEIDDAMAEFGVLDALAAVRAQSGQDLGPYHWGTLYDMLGYSASGSMIDYYNTPEGPAGTGFATELTAGQGQNAAIHPQLLNQVHVDSIRAINYTMFRQAVDKKTFTFPVGGKAAYLFDPEIVTDTDLNGSGYVRKAGENIPQQPYSVTRMKFFEDLSGDADRPLHALRVGQIAADPSILDRYDSLVLANDALPEPSAVAEADWYAVLKGWVSRGGNLIVTDAAARALPKLGLVPESAVTSANHYVGFVDFGDRTDPLNAGLRGVASQTYDTVPIGYSFGGSNSAPNWKVTTAAWTAAGGRTAGINGSGQTIYGELPVGAGRVRFLGALLPDPTEAFYHPYGLQNYAVTYTGYTLLQNMLRWDSPLTP